MILASERGDVRVLHCQMVFGALALYCCVKRNPLWRSHRYTDQAARAFTEMKINIVSKRHDGQLFVAGLEPYVTDVSPLIVMNTHSLAQLSLNHSEAGENAGGVTRAMQQPESVSAYL